MTFEDKCDDSSANTTEKNMSYNVNLELSPDEEYCQKDENATLHDNTMLNNAHLLCFLESIMEEKRRNSLKLEFDNAESSNVKNETERKDVKCEPDKDEKMQCKVVSNDESTKVNNDEEEDDEIEMIFDDFAKMEGFLVSIINKKPQRDHSW